MKIAFLGMHAHMTGGVESVNRTLAAEFIKRGHEVYFGFLRASGSAEEPEGAKVFCAREEAWHLTLGNEIREALSRKRYLKALRLFFTRKKEDAKRKEDEKSLRLWLKKVEPDLVVVSQYLLLSSVPEEMLSRTYFHLHDSFEHARSEAAQYETLLRYRDRVRLIVLSEASKKAAEKDGFSGVTALYNPVSFFGKSEGKNIVVLARLAAQKRIPLLIRLVKKALDETGSDKKLFLYGEGEEQKEAVRAAAGDERIVFKGNTADPRSAWKDAAFTVCTSAYEGFSISVLEAAAMGVPAVSYSFESLGEEILDGVTGIVVPMDDEEKMVRAIRRLLSDEAFCRRLGENARAWARNFSPEAAANAWERKVFSLPLS